MTLVEMLVALAATLLLMTAIAQVFAVFGSAISGSRAMLDLDSRMRTVAWRLRTDLGGATARTTPPLSPSSGEGYFEIIEGGNSDAFMYNFYDVTTGSFTSAVAAGKPFFTGTNKAGPGASDDRLLGDLDDVLLFTARSVDTPFVGRAPTLGGATAAGQSDLFESTVAEIAWFARPTLGSSNPVTYTLYRKQLLVMGYVGTDPFLSTPGSNNRLPVPSSPFIGLPASGSMWSQYYNLPCDVSARLEISASGTALFPNTLGDLTRREARFMHNPTGDLSASGFPFEFVDHQFPSSNPSQEVLNNVKNNGLIFDSTSQRFGEDVVLTNVIAFDVRVFDPAVPVDIAASGNTTLLPGDPGYYKDMSSLYPSPSATGTASGAYVDLGYLAANAFDPAVPSKDKLVTNPILSARVSGTTIYGRFTGSPQPKSQLGLYKRATYDTWSTHYEANGIDEDGFFAADQGTNGLDDNGNGLVDEPADDANGNFVYGETPDDGPRAEAETLPPYPFPLRGIEVRIRCYEPTSQQVRQVTVRHTFVPH